jgi:hypothetical protein
MPRKWLAFGLTLGLAALAASPAGAQGLKDLFPHAGCAIAGPCCEWRIVQEDGKAQIEIRDCAGLRVTSPCLAFRVGPAGPLYRVDELGGQVQIRAGSQPCKAACWPETPEVKTLRVVPSIFSFCATADRVTRGGPDGGVLTLEGNARLSSSGEGRFAEIGAERIVVNLLTGQMNTAGVGQILLDGRAENTAGLLRADFPLTIPGKEAKVVIVPTFTDGPPPNALLMRTDRDLAALLTRLLEERYQESKEKVKVVSQRELRDDMNRNPRWRDVPSGEIGKHFHADWVIDLEIGSITLLDPKDSSFLYRGTADIQITVTDARKPIGEGLVWEKSYYLDYPRDPRERSEMAPATFRGRFLERIAGDLAEFFTAHTPCDPLESKEEARGAVRQSSATSVSNPHPDDPNGRTEQLLFESEDLRQIHEEVRRFWMNDGPSHMTYQRVYGGIGP